MGNDFASTPFDAHHDALDPGSDWRNLSGPLGAAERYVSYGNFAGPGNRITAENSDYVNQQRALDPSYDPVSDPRFTGDPRYQPVDGIDAAAQAHDSGYERDSGGADPFFSWDGMRNVHDDDKTLVDRVAGEMDQNGASYSQTAVNYSEGLRGFFGARVMGVDAVDWAGAKADDIGAGVEDVASGDVGVGDGLTRAGSWLSDTGDEAWDGVSGAASNVGSLGWPGMVGAAAGFGDVALAGAHSAGGAAWDGAKSAEGAARNEAASVLGYLGL